MDIVRRWRTIHTSLDDHTKKRQPQHEIGHLLQRVVLDSRKFPGIEVSWHLAYSFVSCVLLRRNFSNPICTCDVPWRMEYNNVSTLGKLDPYVRINYGKDVYQTTILMDGGCSPIWNFEVSLTGTIPILKVEVYDSRVFKDKLIGYVEISLQSLSLGVQNLAFSLHNPSYPGECAGVLLTKISVFSTNAPTGAPAPRRMSVPQLSSGPTLYPCITHACCCHYNSFPLPSPAQYVCTPVAPCARDSSIYPESLQQEVLSGSRMPARIQPIRTVPLQKQMATIPSY